MLTRRNVRLAKRLFSWDNPRMVTLKADNRRRVQLPDAKPGEVFAYETSGEGQYTLTIVKKAEPAPVPVVKLVRRLDGSYRFPDHAKPSRKAIIASIRADRSSR
jgi:hypothetical protein